MRMLVGLVGLAACGDPSRHAVFATDAPAAYPAVLHPPRTLGGDFMVRQSLTIHAVRDGKPVTAELDAVLQKRGDELLVLGLGPMNVKAFSVTQREATITFEQYTGPRLAFAPRDIIVDVHRVFFKRLLGAAPDGTRAGELDGEHVEETWEGGELRRIVFTRPGAKLVGAVRVELGPGCKPARCEPATATLHNEWFGYTLDVVDDAFEWL
jgi:Protein of unknown function (DUF3261)